MSQRIAADHELAHDLRREVRQEHYVGYAAESLTEQEAFHQGKTGLREAIDSRIVAGEDGVTEVLLEASLNATSYEHAHDARREVFNAYYALIAGNDEKLSEADSFQLGKPGLRESIDVRRASGEDGITIDLLEASLKSTSYEEGHDLRREILLKSALQDLEN